MRSADFFVFLNRRWIRVRCQEVLLIESDNKYCIIYTSNRTYRQDISLSAFMGKVDSRYFCQVHRSYAVSLDRVDAFDTETITIADKQIPIGKIYYQEFITRFTLLRNEQSRKAG